MDRACFSIPLFLSVVLFSLPSKSSLLFSSTLAFWPAINPAVVGVRDYWNYYTAANPEIGGPVHFEIPAPVSTLPFCVHRRACLRAYTSSGPLPLSLTLSLGGQQQRGITQEAETSMRTKGHEIMSHPSIRFRSIVRARNILFRRASRVDHFYHWETMTAIVGGYRKRDGKIRV